MLSREDNDLMCRVGPDTPMGSAMRRYWLPAIASSALPAGPAEPRRVRLLGENFVLFRDASGRIGFLDEYCPHRGTSLVLGRLEPDGIRCLYHAWKFATDGAILDTPNVADPKFKERFRARAYPVREAGGFLWVYLGPGEREPDFPRWPFLDLPDANRLVVQTVQDCNYVQLLEGLLDSSHLTILHQDYLTQKSDLDYAKKVSRMSADAAPAIEAEDTDFGFHYAAVRTVDGKPEARVAAFVAPSFVFNPNGDILVFAIPIDDERSYFNFVFWSLDKKINEEPLRTQQLDFVGLNPQKIEAFGLSPMSCDRPDRPSPANNFYQDRAGMREGKSWTGFPGIIQDDAVVATSASPIRDRSKELLAAADAAIARMYRVLLRSVRQSRSGAEPVGLDRPVDSSKIAGIAAAIPAGGHWRDLVPGHVVLERQEARIPAAT